MGNHDGEPRGATVGTTTPPAARWQGRRIAESISRQSPRGVLLHLIREAREPYWSPLASARRLVARAGSDLDLLRAVLVRLHAVDREAGTVHQRALATITIAIAELEESHPGETPEKGNPTVPWPRGSASPHR